MILIEFRRKISGEDHAMTAVPSTGMSGWLNGQLDQASPDLLHGMARSFAQVDAQVEAFRPGKGQPAMSGCGHVVCVQGCPGA